MLLFSLQYWIYDIISSTLTYTMTCLIFLTVSHWKRMVYVLENNTGVKITRQTSNRIICEHLYSRFCRHIRVAWHTRNVYIPRRLWLLFLVFCVALGCGKTKGFPRPLAASACTYIIKSNLGCCNLTSTKWKCTSRTVTVII